LPSGACGMFCAREASRRKVEAGLRLTNRHFVLLLLVVLAIITFLDRIAIASAGPRIQEQLGISPELWGWILGAFVLPYGIFEIPTGALGDRLG